nr:MAG TPA: hypothetical protein [Caudoviricetes sp.]
MPYFYFQSPICTFVPDKLKYISSCRKIQKNGYNTARQWSC